MIYSHDGHPLGTTPTEAAKTLGVPRKKVYNILRQHGLTNRWRWQDITLPAPPRIGRPASATFALSDGRIVIGVAAVSAALGITRQRIYQRFRRDPDGVWRET